MADTLDTSAFRRGLKIEIDKEPWEIVEFQHVKPGKGSAFVRTRIKNLITNRTIEPLRPAARASSLVNSCAVPLR